MFRNLIFDWSGTIVDDLGPVVDATADVFRKHGLETLDRSAFRESFRLPYGDWWADQLPGIELQEIETLFRAGFAASSAEVFVLPHARQALVECAKAGVRLFVLSSMDEPAFEKQLDDLGMRGIFEATYVGVLDKRNVIEDILARHDLAKADSAYVGDMIHDVETAQHAGITSIAVGTGYNDLSVLVQAEADIYLQDLRGIIRMIPRKRSKDTQRICIRGLQVACHIGVPAEERKMAQTLTLDIDLWGGTSFRNLSDEIAQTIDYHEVVLAVEALAAERERKLVETLAADIIDHLLKSTAANRVKVEVKKSILSQTESVGCMMEKRLPT